MDEWFAFSGQQQTLPVLTQVIIQVEGLTCGTGPSLTSASERHWFFVVVFFLFVFKIVNHRMKRKFVNNWFEHDGIVNRLGENVVSFIGPVISDKGSDG